MKSKFTVPVLVSTLTFSGATALTAQARTSFTHVPGKSLDAAYSVSTVFRCVRQDDGFATIAQRGDRIGSIPFLQKH